MSAVTPTTRAGGRRARRIAILVGIFAPAAVVGAYLDWIWWPVYSGLSLTLAAIAILLAGGRLALIGRMIGRRVVRRVALTLLVVGVGLVAGQNLGPSREPLIQQFGGTMTLSLVSPLVAVATGSADCTNVASATEFAVTGDSNMRLETSDRPFLMIYVNVGDRWQVLDDSPRKDGIRLDVDVTGQLDAADGKPSTVTMAATPSSTLESTFSNAGGSIRFADLVAQGPPDSAGSSMPLAGTLEWTCGEPLR